MNYRERFLVTTEEIQLVLNMYSKNDYIYHFLRLDQKNEVEHSRYIGLFHTALKNDSFKIAMQIYLR